MGTRADFYVGRGEDAEWLGSIAWDGYPDGIGQAILNAQSEEVFRLAVDAYIKGRDDGTLPEMGWPWPWETSHTTDYAYAFDGGQTWGCCFGGAWFPGLEPPEDHEEWDRGRDGAVFPDMAAHKNLTMGRRSGVIVVSAPASESGQEQGR